MSYCTVITYRYLWSVVKTPRCTRGSPSACGSGLRSTPLEWDAARGVRRKWSTMNHHYVRFWNTSHLKHCAKLRLHGWMDLPSPHTILLPFFPRKEALVASKEYMPWVWCERCKFRKFGVHSRWLHQQVPGPAHTPPHTPHQQLGRRLVFFNFNIIHIMYIDTIFEEGT